MNVTIVLAPIVLKIGDVLLPSIIVPPFESPMNVRDPLLFLWFKLICKFVLFSPV